MEKETPHSHRRNFGVGWCGGQIPLQFFAPKNRFLISTESKRGKYINWGDSGGKEVYERKGLVKPFGPGTGHLNSSTSFM